MDEQRIREIVREEIRKAADERATENVIITLVGNEIARAIGHDPIWKTKRDKFQEQRKMEKEEWEMSACYSCRNDRIKEHDNFCNECGFGLTPPKLIYDHPATIKKLLHVFVEDQVLISQVDRVLDMLKEAVMSSSRVQEIWANDDYNNYEDLPLK